VPDRLIVPMKYCVQLTFGGTPAFSRVYSQNSPYDPDVTGVGGLVTGFNSLSALYQRFRVYSSRIRVNAQTTDANSIAGAISAATTNGGSGLTAPQVAAFRYAKPAALKILPVQGFGPAAVLEDSINTSALVGDALYDESSLYGYGSSDPATQFYWIVAFSSNIGTNCAVEMTVELEYLVEWTTPQDAPT